MNFSFVLSCIIIILLSILYINYSGQELWSHFDTGGDHEQDQKFVESVTGLKEVDEFSVNENGEISSAYIIEIEIKKPTVELSPNKEINQNSQTETKKPEEKPTMKENKSKTEPFKELLNSLNFDETKVFDMEKEKELDQDDFAILEEQPPEKIKEKMIQIDPSIHQTHGIIEIKKKSIVRIKYSNNTHWTDKLIL